LFFPFLFLTISGGYYINNLYSYTREVIAFGLFTSVLLVLTMVVKKVRFRKYLFSFFSLLLMLLIFIKLSFYFQYGSKLNSSALYVIFETNVYEASEFFMNFVNKDILVLFFVLLFLLFFIFRKVFHSDNFDLKARKQPVLCFENVFLKIVVLSFTILTCYVIFTRFSYENILLESYTSHQDYLLTKENLKNVLAQKESSSVTNVSSSNEQQTYVVVIGESTSNWHMQLYDYNRQTNPLLTEIKDELYVFEDVISPNVHTILSLEKILTLSNYDNPNKKNNASIVQLANQSGFTTYWLSNQRPVGFYESVPTMIGSAASNKYFINSDEYIFNVYDEKLIPYLDDVLKEHDKKKIIFIHLMGTHNAYDKRYPSKFDFFSGENINTKYKHDRSKKLVNSYDNAIRYNDSIVRVIIDKVKGAKTNSYVAYFSDHGDELYDTLDRSGHDEYNDSAPMYEVPFVVWVSEKYKLKHPEFLDKLSIVKRKYNLEDFIHSFSDLSCISFNEFDAAKSIFNAEFQLKKRMISNNVDYDERKK